MDKNIPGETEEEQFKNMQRFFREVFSTEKGKTVLNIILTDLHYFDLCKTEGEVALNNYAKLLIHDRMGLNDTVNITECLLKGE